MCGFCHRDIKPGNFPIGEGYEMQLALIDFGLSRVSVNPHWLAIVVAPRWIPGNARASLVGHVTAR
jgi:serine/threonine protein kinase